MGILDHGADRRLAVSPFASRLAAHRAAFMGLVYLVVLALLAGVCVLAYRKDLPWQRTVAVTLVTGNPGLELNANSDVKLRSRLVGRVESIDSDGARAVVHLALNRRDAHLVPQDVDAAIVPKTLFGEKFVDLLPQAQGSSTPIADGDVIRQSTTAVELGDVYARLVPLLRSIDPAQLSTVLNGLAGALNGRGEQLGRIITQVDGFLGQLDPHLATLQADIHQLARTLQVYGDAAPDLLRTLGNASRISKDLLVPSEQRLRALLDTVVSTSDLTKSVLDRNAENLVALSGQSRPLLAVLDTYSSVLPCSLRGLHLLDKLGNQVTGARGPFTNLNVDLIVQGDPYAYPHDLPGSRSSDANDHSLPAGVPSFAPHCPHFGRLTQQVKDAKPFSLAPLPFQSRGSSGKTSAYEGGGSTSDPQLATSMAAVLMGRKGDSVDAPSTRLGGMLIAPMAYDGRVTLP
jgi:phospholipid/cholesterol/gamma-HCH transport system substrate-binding protein